MRTLAVVMVVLACIGSYVAGHYDASWGVGIATLVGVWGFIIGLAAQESRAKSAPRGWTSVDV